MHKKIVVLGAGESGVGAAILAKQKGFDVWVSETAKISSPHRYALQQAGIAFEENGHSLEHILKADEVIKSPGISNTSRIVQHLQQAGKPIVSEIEFAARYTQGIVIAVTGTNGKTTTTLLLHHLLKVAGLDVEVAGNVGYSFARRLAQSDHAYWVLEVSSFQLDHCFDFHPHIAVITGLSPDHLDRYPSYEAYGKAKMRICQRQNEKDYLVFNYESKDLRALLAGFTIAAQQVPVAYSWQPGFTHGAWADAESIQLCLPKRPRLRLAREVAHLPGRHNLSNMLCALSAAALLGIDANALALGLHSFPAIAHRMEPVGQIDGVDFINDSKATNVESVWYALEAFEPKNHIIWIAGGVDKGNQYTQLDELVQSRVKHLVCLGKDNSRLIDFFGKKVSFSQARNMEEAVQQAIEHAQAGDVVLLSPACASFDLFRNYEDRGDQFRQCVQLMQQKRKTHSMQ